MTPSRRSLLTTLVVVATLAAPATVRATTLLQTTYAGGPTGWQAFQQPVGTKRLTAVPAPAPLDPRSPGLTALRAELLPGDLFQGRARAEAYGRVPSRMTTTPATKWPDPVGSTRYYAFSLYVPDDFVTATDAKWLTLTQWKGLRGGSPPIAIEIKRASLRLGGTRANAGLLPATDLGPIVRGRWTQLTVGLTLSGDPALGAVEVYRDGVLVVPRTPVATMDVIAGSVDPVYLKQGLYRASDWQVPQTLYFGPTRVATELADVLPAG